MKWGKKVALLPQPCRLCNTSRNLHTAEAILKSQGLLPGNGAAQHPAHQRGPVGKTQPSQINIAGVISAQLSSVLLPDFFSMGFPLRFLVCSWFLTRDMSIYVHYYVNIKSMEVALISVPTADDGVVFVLADSKSVTLSGQNI